MFQKYIMADLDEKLVNILFQESIDDEIVMVKRQLITNPNNTNTIMRLMTLADRSGNKELGEEALKLGHNLAERLKIDSIDKMVSYNFPLELAPDSLRWNFYGDVGEMFDNELANSIVSVEYSVDSGERATHDYPGSPGGIEPENVVYDYKPASMWYNFPTGVYGNPEKFRTYIVNNIPVPFSVAFHASEKVYGGEIDFRFAGYAEITKIGPVQEEGGKFSEVDWRFPHEDAVEITASFEPEYASQGDPYYDEDAY